MRLLVVEDDSLVRHLIDRAMSKQGHHTMVAPSVFEAMALLVDFPASPDLALLDLVLPGMGGLVYADLLQRQFPSIRLAFMTGWLDHGEVAEAQKRGRLLPKPFTLRQLFQALDLLPDPRWSDG